MKYWISSIVALVLFCAVPPVVSGVLVTGTVTDPEGAPVAGARIAFTCEADTSQTFEDATASDGVYRVVLSPTFTAVEEIEQIEQSSTPVQFQLFQNYPNPFNPATVIRYALPREMHVKLDIFNILGHQIRNLVHTHQEAGWHAVTWDGRDRNGKGVSAGVYLYRLKAGDFTDSGKMVMTDGADQPVAAPLSSPSEKPVSPEQDRHDLYTITITGDYIESFSQSGISIPEDMVLDFVVETVAGEEPFSAIDLGRESTIIIKQGDTYYSIYETIDKPLKLFDEEGRRGLLWSPDGTKVIHGASPMMIMEADGRNERVLTGGMNPTWSWDGNYIVMVNGGLIYRVDVNTGEEVELSPAEPMPPARRAFLSPDGTRVLIDAVGTRDGCMECTGPVYLMDLDGSNIRLVSDERNLEVYQAFSPDGSRIVVTRNGDHGFDITMVDLETLEAVGRADDGRQGLWSSAGNNVAFIRVFGMLNWNGLYILSSEGKDEEILHLWGTEIFPTVFPSSPHWSPDGEKIVFTIHTHVPGENNEVLLDKYEVFLINKDGTGLTKLIDGNAIGWFSGLVPKVIPPTADAGPDHRTAGSGETVQFDGSGSYDPDGKALSYIWTEDPDNPATGLLSDAMDVAPTFAPSQVGVYRFTLVVNNGTTDSKPDEIAITVSKAISVELPGGAMMEFVWIPPGTFLMGSPDADPTRFPMEGPQHEVTITQGFWLGRYEITQQQWESVMGTRPWSEQEYAQENPNHPTVYISWDDVQEFIRRLNEAAGETPYRLPTEAEWEYACRAGTTTFWSFGDDPSPLVDHAWYKVNAWDVDLQYAQPVGAKRPNPWGVCDMHGNVYEWCQDRYGPDYYSHSPSVDPPGPESGSLRVRRGGDFKSSARSVRPAYRRHASPGDRRYYLGARLVQQEP